MSHLQFHYISSLILRHAWLNLWNKHITTGRINQITSFSPRVRLSIVTLRPTGPPGAWSSAVAWPLEQLKVYFPELELPQFRCAVAIQTSPQPTNPWTSSSKLQPSKQEKPTEAGKSLQMYIVSDTHRESIQIPHMIQSVMKIFFKTIFKTTSERQTDS